MAATEPMMRWLDLSSHGVKLRLFRQTDSIVNLVMTGVPVDSEEWRAVQALGFVPSATGHNLIREGSDVQTGALRRIFPRNDIRELPHSAVWIRVKGQGPTQAPETTQDGSELGRNAQGRTVRFREDGVRYVTLDDGKTLSEREVRASETDSNIVAAEIAASFLRAPNAEALALCADAFVEEMIAGKNMDSNDLRHFGGVIHAEADARNKPLDITDARLRTLQEAVEASMQRNLFTRHREASEHAYRFAVGLSERQPTFAFRTSTSVQNQQYSTPLPMSIAAQHILGDTTGRKLFEPTIGNGSLVTALPVGTDITGVEIDPARAAQVSALRPDIKLTTGDVLDVAVTLDADFDFVVANPPFGGLQPPVEFENLRVNRIDHLIAVKALARRKVDGRGVFIIAADRESLIEGGRIAGGSKTFFAWLADHYEIEDAVELDGALYRKQGAEYPVRMVTVGRRRTEEDATIALRTKAYRLGERLPVISTWDDLWEHTQGLAKRLHQGVRHAPPVTEYEWSAQLRAGQKAKVGAQDQEVPGSPRGDRTIARAPLYLVLAQDLADENGLSAVTNGGIESKEEWERGTPQSGSYVSLRAHPSADSGKGQYTVQRVIGGQLVTGTYDSDDLADRAINAETRQEFDALPSSEQTGSNALTAQAESEAHGVDVAGEQTGATVAYPSLTDSGEAVQQEAVVNDYQAPYIPASKINEPSSMIPRNLEGPVRRALAALVEEIGMGVDEYVAGKLQMDQAEMELAFSAEQVDAIALAIKRTEEGRGFINGDQTGQGKGRVLAALARYAVLNNRPVVFTTEKANLFSDFWRDLKDIDSHHLFRPLILNSDEPIRNMDTGKIEVPSLKTAALRSLLDADLSLQDAGYNLMLATYSQFNRERSTSAKATWLPTAAKGAMMLLDESHVAAGDSNTADNMALAVEHAASCVYSSATFAKNAKNMRAYAKVFPKSVAVESLADTLTAGGEPLQEILSAMLGEEGVFIRREHDLSKLEFEMVATEDTRERDEQWADALSDALRTMSYFSGDVTRVMKRMDKAIKKHLEKLPESVRKGNRMGVAYQGFGSRLYNILRQFSLAIKIDKVADRAIAALREGHKPVIVLEQTFEALLKESITNSIRHDDEELTAAEEIARHAEDAFSVDGDGRMVDALTFRDVMTRVADKLQYIYVRDDYGNGHYENVEDQAENEAELLQIRAHIAEIHEKIARLPDIPVSPIDTLRQKLKEAGFTNGEISGRSFQTEPVPGDPTKIQVTIRPDQRIQTLADFNNGRVDSMTLTRAGSTGLSAHSSTKFADQRQRVMIEAQITNNVAERVQFFGRVNRRGQANSPIIVTVITPLPSEKRILAMQNAKLRKLSANTQSNRNNQAEMRDVPDILNSIGNEICRRYLAENPDIAALLDIDPEEENPSDDEAYFANKLTGRIALLPVVQQKSAYAELSRVFEETLKEMESRGVNPFETSVWEWGAKIVSREIFRGGERSGSVFDEPVYLARIEWEEDLVPYTSEDIKHALQMSRNHLTQTDNRFTLSENRYATREHEKWRIDATALVRDVDAAFDNVQTLALKSQPQFKTVQEAIDSKESNPIKNSQMRRDWFKKQLPGLLPGGIISFTGREEEAEKAMITGFFPPEERREAHLLGQYSIRVVVPGSDKHRELTVNQLLGDPLFGREYSLGSDYNDPLKAFDTTKPGRITFSRQVLMGNMFIASQFIAQQRMGSAGIFTDETGARHRAAVLFGWVSRADVMDMPVSLNRSQMSRVLERAYTEGYSVRLVASSTLNDKNCCAVIFDRNRPATLTIATPGSKATGGPVYGNKDLLDITGDFAGNRTTMSATVDFSKMEPVVETLVNRCGQSFYMDSQMAKRLLPEMTAAEDAQDVAFGEAKQSDQSDAPAGDRPSRPRFAA